MIIRHLSNYLDPSPTIAQCPQQVLLSSSMRKDLFQLIEIQSWLSSWIIWSDSVSEQFFETRSIYWFFQESKNIPSKSLTVSCTATLPMKLLKRCLLLDWSGLPLSVSFERLIARGQKLSIPNWRPEHLVVANSPIWICRPRGDILLYLKLVCKWMILLKMNRISTFSCDTTETEYN